MTKLGQLWPEINKSVKRKQSDGSTVLTWLLRPGSGQEGPNEALRLAFGRACASLINAGHVLLNKMDCFLFPRFQPIQNTLVHK